MKSILTFIITFLITAFMLSLITGCSELCPIGDSILGFVRNGISHHNIMIVPVQTSTNMVAQEDDKSSPK